MGLSLWGDEFVIEDKKKTEKVVKKVKEKKEVSVEKKLKSTSKSTKLTLEERLALITSEVYRILGVYKENTICIRTREELHNYIDKAIANNCIAVDTETNNSLDPITCKLMGGCIYTPGEKNAYIPVNHVDKEGNLLTNQVTEKDIYEEFSRLNNTFTIMHNGKFDYAVLKCTCGLHMRIDWDTLICAKILDENEHSAGLKQQYIDKIDSSIEKYSIEHLFKDVEYKDVDPDLFALYAATDSYMTYKLYEWQKAQLDKSENKKLYSIFNTVEMPMVEVIAEMEMAGMEVDQDYASLLSAKYHKNLDALDKEINVELDQLKPLINQWRLTPEANYKPPKTRGDGEGKSKNEQLTDPLNLASPTQLAILLYDILKAPQVSKKSPRGTGEDELVEIGKKLKLPLCDLLVKRRGMVKLLTTYIDSIPELAKRWPDGRVRTHFQQYGAACITANSVVVNEYGVLPITSIGPDFEGSGAIDFNYNLINEKNEIESTVQKHIYRDVETVHILTEYGFELEGTPNHMVRVLNKNRKEFLQSKSAKVRKNLFSNISWKRLDELSVDDLVLIDGKVREFNQDYIPINCEDIHKRASGKIPKVIDEEFAEFLGMLHADGAVKTRDGCTVIILYNEHQEVVDRFRYLCKKLFDRDIYKNDKSTEYISGWCCYSAKFDFLYNYFTTGKYNKKIPVEILQSRDSVFYAYLKGVSLDSGWNGSYLLTYHIYDELDCKAIQQRLLKQHILCSCNLNHKKAVNNHSGLISIRKEFIDKFLMLTNGVYIKHGTRVLYQGKYKYHRFYDDGENFAVAVKSIDLGKNTVYDFTLPETHSFLSNGFVSHNTGRLSSSDPLNFQNIPSHDKTIRMLFKARVKYNDIAPTDDYYEVKPEQDVLTTVGWKRVKNLNIGDNIKIDDMFYPIINMIKNDANYRIYC